LKIAANSHVRSTALESGSGLRVKLLDLGAAIQSITVPTLHGRVDCVLGYPDPGAYSDDQYYLGVTVGRYANRLCNAQARIGDVEFNFDRNESTTGHCLHGGRGGFHRQHWSLENKTQSNLFTYHLTSQDGDQGFPGKVDARVTYRLLDDFVLSIEFVAESDAETVINMANHAYFNLDRNKDSIDTHQLQLMAAGYTPVDGTRIPTGEVLAVDRTAFDLRAAVALKGRSFDHNFVLDGSAGELRPAAFLYSPQSGIGLRIHTTQPGMQVYTGEGLGLPFKPRQGIALEAQNFPDAPNQPGFPSATLFPGRTYRHQTVYEFIPQNGAAGNDTMPWS